MSFYSHYKHKTGSAHVLRVAQIEMQHKILLFLAFAFLVCNSASTVEKEKPKHVLFVSVPMHGHVNALKPFAQEMVDR